MITIHHLGISQSERIVWQCEEQNVAYTLKRYARDPETRLAPEAYKALHPSGTSPVVSDGSQVLAESGAIMEYIDRKYGGSSLSAKPEDSNFADYLFWFHYANGSHQPHLMGRMIANMLGYEGGNVVLDAVLGRVERGIEMMEQQLGKTPYLAGEQLSLADIMMFFQLTTMANFVPGKDSAAPNIAAYIQRVSQRPAYRTAMEKCDPELLAALDS